MKRKLRLYFGVAIASLIAIVAWIAIVMSVNLLGMGQIAVTGPGSASLMDAAKPYVDDHRGNLVMVLVDDGRVAGRMAHSIGREVDEDTLFQMASVSKWVTAWGVMTLVEAGRLDLDAPVSRYLHRWQLPAGDGNNEQVTVRRLLSHTAGLTDGLGYCGFAPGRPIQTLEQSLTRAADACPFRDGKFLVGGDAGDWQYSGAGYTLLQLLIEEVSGQTFADYMDSAVLRPLGMVHSTFNTGAAGLPKLAQFFAGDGSFAPHNRYTASGAASLYTSAADLTLFVQAQLPRTADMPPKASILSPRTIEKMRSAQVEYLTQPHWGLGMRLYAPNGAGDFIIGHDGGNTPAVNTTVRLDPTSGDAIIVLSTGGEGAANALGAAWLRQRVAEADLPNDGLNLLVVAEQASNSMWWIIGGVGLILVGGCITVWRLSRRSIRGN